MNIQFHPIALSDILERSKLYVYILYYNLSEELNFVSDIQTEEECRHDKLATIIQHCQMNICVKQ